MPFDISKIIRKRVFIYLTARCLEKELVKDLHGLLRVLDRVTLNIRMAVNFEIVTAFVSLVTEEVNFRETLVLDVTQAVSLIPSSGEDIERNLSTNGESQLKVRESSSQV